MEYFADSYALIEYVKGNYKYKKYFEKDNIITTRLNLMELFYATLLEGAESAAEKYYDSFLSKCIEIKDETIKEAMKLRYRLKKKKLSYVDAISYQISLENGIKLLTGDKEFKTSENVEFVK